MQFLSFLKLLFRTHLRHPEFVRACVHALQWKEAVDESTKSQCNISVLSAYIRELNACITGPNPPLPNPISYPFFSNFPLPPHGPLEPFEVCVLVPSILVPLNAS